MAAVSKIDKYNLSSRLLALFARGKSGGEIAEILTDELEGKDTISRTSVNRFLVGVREERQTVATSVIDKFIRQELPSDLKLLTDLKSDYLSIRSRVFAIVTGAAEELPMAGTVKSDLKTLLSIDDRLHELIKTTFRFVGVPGGDDSDGGIHPVDLSEYKTEIDEFKKQAGVK